MAEAAVHVLARTSACVRRRMDAGRGIPVTAPRPAAGKALAAVADLAIATGSHSSHRRGAPAPIAGARLGTLTAPTATPGRPAALAWARPPATVGGTPERASVAASITAPISAGLTAAVAPTSAWGPGAGSVTRLTDSSTSGRVIAGARTTRRTAVGLREGRRDSAAAIA